MSYPCLFLLLNAWLPAAAPSDALPPSDEWQNMPGPWLPLDRHPRPDWARPWVDLNGPWRFDFDPEDKGVEERWFEGHTFSKTITVPYPWQSSLSGIHAPDYQGTAWYERDIPMPTGFREGETPRVFLVFGAVDWEATVWVNGKEAVRHEGGYTPFEIEVSRFAEPGETARVTVRARDITDPETPNGKQTGWYTPTGGIWQSVYLECRPQAFLKSARITPNIDTKEVRIVCRVEPESLGMGTLDATITLNRGNGPLTSQRSLSGDLGVAASQGAIELTMQVPELHLWTPDSPTLYDLELTLTDETTGTKDTVRSYFGMRKIGRGTYGGSEHEYILLNDKPIYLRGALHQSFNPEGIYTHPNDDYIRRDYEKAKEFGLNFIRIHIKVEEPRALYWADRLGVMLMCDMPNFNKKTDRAKRLWEETLRAAIDRDYNHPSIIAWCDFNETWGIRDGGYDRATQDWVVEMYRLTKELDPTRLVEENSPCFYDHTETDINSWHFYIDDYEEARKHVEEVVEKTFPGSTFNFAEGYRQGTQPLINSEYGGVSAGGGDRDIGWCFLHLTNLLRKHGKICGYVYTELEDIEWEHNGFMNYDRSDKAFPYPAGITLADLQGDEFAVLDCPPYQEVDAGAEVSVPILLSHWSERDGLSLRISADGRTIDGKPWSAWLPPVERPAAAQPFTVAPQDPFAFTVPDGRGILNLVVEVKKDGKRLAANYCVFNVRNGAVWNEPNSHAATFPVDAFAEYTFGDDLALQPEPGGPAKVFGRGTGAIEYALQLPADLKPDAVRGARLLCEVGAKAGRELVDWPERVNRQDYPQTDGRRWPTQVRVSVEDAPVRQEEIPTDFADVQGVLSHAAYYQHGSHGILLDLPIEGDAFAQLKAALGEGRPLRLRFEVPEDAAHKGGLAIYGRNMGMWPSDPTLLFTLADGAAMPQGETKPTNVLRERFLPLLQKGPNGHTWRYTTANPGDNWTGPDFDDSGWSTGQGGFGREGTPGARIATPWLDKDIWLRTTVEATPGFGEKPVWIDLHHDEDAEVYVNGQLLLKRARHTTDYERIVLTREQKVLFRPGEPNVIAVHCRQTAGGQYIDLALTTME
jgi:hypothetical protein